MSRWAGKYVIGLTGNIGTGKSVVRKMLEHLGAYGIDADALSHRAIARGAPAYQPVRELFGTWILDPDEQINRRKLGKVVFGDPQALAELEGIIHPFVSQAVDLLVRRSKQPVVVVEAIKLLESPLKTTCDNIWVVYCPPELQMARLMQNRAMNEADSRQRIKAQPPQEEKLAAAGVVIRNASSFENTWKQVNAAWAKIPIQPVSAPAVKDQPAPAGTLAAGTVDEAGWAVQRGRPRDSQEIADLMNRILKPAAPFQKTDIMAAFGDKAYLLLRRGSTAQAVIGWKVENLIARTTDIIIEPGLDLQKALPTLLQEMESASIDLQCEVSLLFLPAALQTLDPDLRRLGYEARSPESLGIPAWKEAVLESRPANTRFYFKQLRVDRILRPI